MKDEFEGLPTLEPHIRDFITTAEGFTKRFWENFRYFSTQEEAYEATERQYDFITGRNRYKDFNSFRATRDRKTTAKRKSIKKAVRKTTAKAPRKTKIAKL